MWSGGSVLRDLPNVGVVEVGRGEEAAVRIESASISRRHARLHLGDDVQIEDLGSSNGTFVEGRRLAAGATQVVRSGSVIELGAVMLTVRDTREPSAPPPRTGSLVVADPAMERLHQLVELVAKSSLNVLLLGETGAGKDVIARRVHELSPRAGKPMVTVNCAALVESLLEGELFGHEKGAFTGAVQAKAGLLETADGSTLFLDEIGEMPLTTQAKLLRVLESGEVTRVGGVKPRKVDVRFVAATNRSPKDEIARGTFRQDLFFRLDGISIRVPPLRERPSEIAALARAFAVDASEKTGRGSVTLSDAALMRLVGYSWPGNVRELRNVIRRAVLLCPGPVVLPEHLHFEPMGLEGRVDPPVAAPSRPTIGGASAEIDEDRVRNALEQCAGNQTRAAKLLGVSRSTLVRWLDQIAAPRPRK
jgi:two-component system, NtrC family, response regulator AtoC